MWQVQYEWRGISIVEELVCKTWCLVSFHKPWHFSRHLGSVFWHHNELLRQSCSCTSSCILSTTCWPTCWPKINDLLCGSLTTVAHVKPCSSGGCLQSLLLYAEARCSLNTDTTKRIMYHFTLFYTICTSARFQSYCSFLKKSKPKIFSVNDLFDLNCVIPTKRESKNFITYKTLFLYARDTRENLKMSVL